MPQTGSQVQQGFLMGRAAAAISAFRGFPYHLEPFTDFILHVLAHGKFGKQVPVNMTGIGGQGPEQETFRTVALHIVRHHQDLFFFRFRPQGTEFPFAGGWFIPQEPKNG